DPSLGPVDKALRAGRAALGFTDDTYNRGNTDAYDRLGHAIERFTGVPYDPNGIGVFGLRGGIATKPPPRAMAPGEVPYLQQVQSLVQQMKGADTPKGDMVNTLYDLRRNQAMQRSQQGWNNTEIANEIGVTPNTVWEYLSLNPAWEARNR